MKKLKILCMCLGFLFLSACYDLPFPAGSEDNARFDESLLGEWVKDGGFPKLRPASMKVTKHSDKTYLVKYTDAENIEYMFKAHVNDISGQSILSLRHPREELEKKPQYAIYRYKLMPDASGAQKLSVSMMKISNPWFTTREAFLAYMKKNESNVDKLFESPMQFRKVPGRKN